MITIKTFKQIEFSDDVVTLHGVGTLGYSQSFDLDSVDSAKPLVIRGQRCKMNSVCVIDALRALRVINLIDERLNRLKPSGNNFHDLMTCLMS